MGSVHTMKEIAAADTQPCGALSACNALPSGSIPSIRKTSPELRDNDAVYRICHRLSMQNLRLGATRKDVLAMIVFSAVRHRPKFDARDFVLFEKQADPTTMVFLGNTSL